MRSQQEFQVEITCGTWSFRNEIYPVTYFSMRVRADIICTNEISKALSGEQKIALLFIWGSCCLVVVFFAFLLIYIVNNVYY